MNKGGGCQREHFINFRPPDPVLSNVLAVPRPVPSACGTRFGRRQDIVTPRSAERAAPFLLRARSIVLL